jgi:hypothetical protein
MFYTWRTRKVTESQRQRSCKCYQIYGNKQTESDEEASEFPKLMKHNEYSVVEQLKKTPVKIPLMSLILSSKPYHNAL